MNSEGISDRATGVEELPGQIPGPLPVYDWPTPGPLGIGGIGSTIPVGAGDILEYVITCWYSTQLQLGLNVRHYRVSQLGATPPSLGACADEFSAAVGPAYAIAMSASAQYWGTSVRRIWPRPVSALAYSTTGRAVGGVAGDPLPKQVCGLITLRSVLGGRENRGRAYIPFPSETHCDTTSRPTAGYITGLANIASALMSLRQVGGVGQTMLQPVIWHRALHTTTDIVLAKEATVFATQRRRGDYGRVNAVPFP